MSPGRRRPAPVASSAFAGFSFPPDVIVLAVRWYLRFDLSYRDVEELLAERSIEVDHVTVYRWVQRFTPLLAEAARPCWHAIPAGGRGVGGGGVAPQRSVRQQPGRGRPWPPEGAAATHREGSSKTAAPG
jgi:hypothetical protein